MDYWLICYDIRDNKQRKKISDTMLNCGLGRVQKSVFEGFLSPKKLKHLQGELKKRCGKGDSIRYYRLCPGCRKRICSWPETPAVAAKGSRFF